MDFMNEFLEKEESILKMLKTVFDPEIPVNYYPDDDPSQEPILSWRSSSNCTYTNWLNLVYQDTPYDLNELRPIEEDSYTIKNTLE